VAKAEGDKWGAKWSSGGVPGGRTAGASCRGAPRWRAGEPSAGGVDFWSEMRGGRRCGVLGSVRGCHECRGSGGAAGVMTRREMGAELE
jgi:hypothetical protein